MADETLAAAAIVIFATYSIFGLTGFGSTALAVPLLVHLIPLGYVVPLLVALDLLAALLVSGRARRGVRVDELVRVLPFMFGGIVLGLTLLMRVPEQPLLVVLGVFLVGYATYGLIRRAGAPQLTAAWSAPFGLVSGAFSSLFGNGGVLMALYLGGRLRDKDELRATAAAMVLLNSAIRVVLFAVVGLLTQEGLLVSAALLVPSVLGGLYLGNRLHAVVSVALVLRVVYLVVVVAGISLLVRAILVH